MESPTALENPIAEATATMMRTLVGVDADQFYLPSLDLLGRLQFAGNRVTLAHIDPPIGAQFGPAPMVYAFDDQADLAAKMRMIGGVLLNEASHQAAEAGLGESLDTVYDFGPSSVGLMQLADERHADLIAIGSGLRGAMGSIFLGSVGRALAIGAHQSFLVARDGAKRTGKVHAVFATDHSDYADRCLRRLLDMDPQGLGRLTLLTATDPRFEAKVASDLGLDEASPYALSQAEARLRESGERQVARWRARGVETDVRLVEGHPTEAIRQTMEETGADLLVLGARGHGLIERVFIGSLALHAVVAEPYSVLVVRLPENE